MMNPSRSVAVLVIMATVAMTGLQSMAQAASPGPSNPASPGKGRGEPAEVLAASPGASPEVLALMKKQEHVSGVATEIKAESTKLGRSVGLGGLVTDPRRAAITVYWHGRVPTAVGRQIAEGREKGVEITVSPSPYTQEDLKAMIARLMAFSLDHGDHVASAAPKADGSGLKIGMRSKDRAEAQEQARTLLKDLRIDVPYEIRANASSVFAENQRNADTPPFWGGGRILGPTSDCTAGFGVTSLSNQQTYMLTAAHCGQGQFLAGSGLIMGSTELTRPTNDAQLIRASTGTEFFIGEWWGGSEWSALTVSTATANNVGDLVCTSGAYSGSVCNISVTETEVTEIIEGDTITDLVRATQLNNIGAIGPGDSGGPVYVPNADRMHGHARGLIVGNTDGARTGSCQGDQGPPSDPRVCVVEFVYEDIFDATAVTGVVLNTA